MPIVRVFDIDLLPEMRDAFRDQVISPTLPCPANSFTFRLRGDTPLPRPAPLPICSIAIKNRKSIELKTVETLKGQAMGQFGAMIADAASVSQRYAKRLLVGIPVDRFARFAAPGKQMIESNHPAFILGHLSLYPINVLELLAVDTTPVQPSNRFTALFSKDAKCQDDAHGIVYPSMQEVSGVFFKTYEVALTAMRDASDSQLSVENPVDTPLKQVCPTLGSMLAFYLTGHVAMHLGQLSTWRRMEGMPPA
jgi:hypothetical protein